MTFSAAQTARLSRRAAALTEGSGGGHTEYRTGRAMGRYVVGGVAPALILPVGTPVGVIREAVRRMVERAGDADAETLGVWEDNGALYFDLGDTWTLPRMALDMGRMRGELAIYDRESGDVVPVLARAS